MLNIKKKLDHMMRLHNHALFLKKCANNFSDFKKKKN